MAKKKVTAKKAATTNWLAKFNDEGMLRVDFMIPLLAMEPSEQLVAAFEDTNQETAMEWLMYDPKDREDVADFEYQYADDERGMAQALLESRYGEFLAHLSSPVMDGNRFSWGHTYNKYILGTSLEDIIEKAYKWKDSIGKKKKVVKKK